MADDFQISTLNMLSSNANLAITEGLASDPPYLYATPHNNYVIAKIDTRSFTVVDTLDLSQVNPGLTGMLGAFVVGGFLYILPHGSATGSVYQSSVVRVDLANFTPSGCKLLAVLAASSTISGSNGMTDGTNGYLNLTVNNQVSVTRFGLGTNFNAASVSMLTITTIQNYPVLVGNLIAIDKTNVYLAATCITKAGTGKGDRVMDMWLVTVPIANFTAKAATFQRLTNGNYVGGSVPRAYTAVDDGSSLWLFPMPFLSGPMMGKFIGTMQIPKANPAKVMTYPGPSTQPFPPQPIWAGSAFFDGWRYGYGLTQTTCQIMQLDTHNPGIVNLIDYSAASSYPMFGLGYDGEWGYAASFNGALGLCLKFLPTQQ